ncbi:hypothetical protein ACLBOM_10040 [Escherichia coli]
MPVIYGCRMGVRESLEEQTMNMAKATAALLTEETAPCLRSCRRRACHFRYLYRGYG